MTRRDTFEGCSLVDVLDRLEKGRIGHQAAMHWLHIESPNDLVNIVYGQRPCHARAPGHDRRPEDTRLVAPDRASNR